MASDFVRQFPLPGGARTRLSEVHLDALLCIAILAVIVLGLVVHHYRDDDTFYGQMLRMAVGLAALVAAAWVQPRQYLSWAPVVYGVSVGLLILVLLIGTTAKGSQRWIDLPGLPQFQPSELTKIAIPLMLAWYFHDRRLPPGLGDMLVALGIIAVPVILVVQQPDLGTGVLVAASGLAVIVLVGVSWRWIAGALALGVAAAPILWMSLHDYQQERIRTLFNPEKDPLGAGWSIIQSTTAIGSGGLLGKGVGEGTQSRLDFLPEGNTDFIIAVIGEETGFVGVLLLMILYLVILARGLRLATLAPNRFGRLLAGGLMLTFFAHVFVNIAMVCGLIPVVGVPLPLVSYGGTSALSILIGCGIVMSIHTHRTGRR